MKKKVMPYKASTLVADKSFAEMMKKTKGIPPCIEPGSLDGIDMKVVSLEEPVFQFREIRPREKNIDFNKLQSEEISEDELNEAYTRGEEYGRTAGAKNELEYLINRVRSLWETDIRKQQIDDELEFAYEFAINLLNGELNKYKSYNLDRGANK